VIGAPVLGRSRGPQRVALERVSHGRSCRNRSRLPV
jgi:hypothetical protein